MPHEMITLAHPGPATAMRAVMLDAGLLPPFSCRVESGADLFTTIEAAVVVRGAATATFTLQAGEIARLTIMTGGPARAGSPVGFCGPHAIAGPVRIVAGTGICGLDEAGHPACHCHAVFVGSDGRLIGGHLIRGQSIAGTQGVEVEIHPVCDAAFQRARDEETGFAVFHPVPW